jgi:phosphate transport system permease protein
MTDTTFPDISIDPDKPPSLAQSWSEGRALGNLLLTIGAWLAALLAAIPLLSVLYMLIVEGGSRLSLELFTELPPAGFEPGGGFGNASSARWSWW